MVKLTKYLVMKKRYSIFLGLLASILVLTSCNGANPNSSDVKSNESDPFGLTDAEMYEILSGWEPEVSIEKNEDLEVQFDEMEAIPEEDSERLSSALFDVKRDSKLNIAFTNQIEGDFRTSDYQSIITTNSSNDYISVVDQAGREMDLCLANEYDKISLQFDDKYEYGAVYTVQLNENSGLGFVNKDASIKRLTVEIEDDPHEEETYSVCTVKKDIPIVSLDNVSDEVSHEDKTLTFTYDGDFPSLQKDDVFLVKKDLTSTELEITDFYGKYVSKTKLDNGKWSITYVEPQGGDIYEDLRLKGNEPVDLNNLEVVATTKSIQEQFRYSDTARGLLQFFAKEAKTTNKIDLDTLMKHIKIGIDFKYVNNVLTFAIKIIGKNIKLADNLYLSLGYTYQKVTRYFFDFDVSVKTKYYIPVGVSYKIKCVEEVTESHSFFVAVDYVREVKERTEEEIKQAVEKAVSDAKANKDNFFKRIAKSAEAGKQTQGNKTTFPLFKLPIPIYGALIFEIRLDFIIDFSIQAMFMAKKQWRTDRVVFNFSNQDGGGRDTHQKVKESSTWNFSLMGKAEIKFTLRLAAAFYFRGTYKYLHVEVFVDFYILVGIQGTLMASFSTGAAGDTFSGNMSIDLYVVMGADVGFEVVVLIFDTGGSYRLFKTYILRLFLSNEIEHYSDDAVTSFDMNKTEMSLDETNVLLFRVWDGIQMIMDTRKFKAGEKAKILESWFGDATVRYFQYKVEDESLISISEDGVIKVKDGTPTEFTTHFTIHLSNWVSFVSDRTIEVHFFAPDAHHIYIDDQDMGRYRPGVRFSLPEGPAKEGYKFLNYEYNGKTYLPGDDIVMGNEDIHITAVWHKLEYFNVYFYDGLNNLVYTAYHVEEYTKSPEPTEEVRDRFMQGYAFIGWDKDISSISTDLVVRGIYVKVGN